MFLIDEIELGMHLEWSRKLIGEYIKFVNNHSSQDKKIQLIFTTHSPYMLSDIKPGNVIMLEKDKSGQSKANVLENTFAKNIQEIMKENLIEKVYGDFALDKINSLIADLQDDELSEDTDGIIKKQIQLISEPILRNKLLEMYDKKFKTESLLGQKLDQLDLTIEQKEGILEQVRKMIEENELRKNEKE